MTLLQWKTDFALGIPAIDHEHREMIELINECHARLGGDLDAGAIEDFLGEIHTGIAAHFALEEQIMRKAEYAEFEAHKDDHEELLDQLRDLMDIYQQDPQVGQFLLQQKLGDWFSHHFSTFDARLHHHLG
jgi:hemerythrin-like metal-binding protein